METNSTADEPMPPEAALETGPDLNEPPEAPVETAHSAYIESPPPPEFEQGNREPVADSSAGSMESSTRLPGDSLGEIAARAQSGRLSPAEEERASSLVKEALLAGKAGVADAVDLLPHLPWIVGVNGVSGAWPEMKATAKTQLIKSLTENESDAARRLRLSLARGLFKQDLPVALKIAAGVSKEMWDKETAGISVKSAQIFSNVFIGKAKPWVVQLPLTELKPAEADALIHCALLTVFTLPHPPVAQLGIMKWAAEAGRLAKVQEPALTTVLNGLSRWSAKWQAALRREAADLPEVFSSVLRPAAEEPSARRSPETSEKTETEDRQPDLEGQSPDTPVDSAEKGATLEAGKKERPVYEPRPQRPVQPSEPSRESRRERPVYQPRNAPAGVANFNLSETFRQIEAHISALRAELSASQAKLRQKEEDPRKSRRSQERGMTIIEGDRSAEELARLNLQLEGRITELQQRIHDLLADAEDRAASLGAEPGQSAADADTQLRSLLALKLQENFADFRALEKESPSVVVQQHYKSLLREVFGVLQREGVPLKE